MKRIGNIAAWGIGALLVFWIGFALNFPGASLSRLVKARAAKAMPQLTLELAPASLGFFSVGFDKVRIGWIKDGKPLRLVELTDASIPFSWRLISGLPLEAELGKEGNLDVFMGWSGEEIEIEGTRVRLEDIPAWAALGGVSVKGNLELEGAFTFPKPGANQPAKPPTGGLTGAIQQLEVSNVNVMGAAIPPAKLDTVQLKLTGGRQLTVENLAFQGDAQGSLKGTITPRMSNLSNSRINLTLRASFKESWLRGLGSIKPIVDSILDQGRITGRIAGTVGRPQWQKGGG